MCRLRCCSPSPGRSREQGRGSDALAQAIEDGPIPAIHGVVRWRVIDLVQWLSDDFQVTMSKQTLSRELRQMGYRRLSARPRHHAQAAGAIDAFKNVWPAPSASDFHNPI